VISTAPGTTPGNGNVLTYYLPLYAWSGATGIANQSAATFNGVTFSFDVYTTFSGSESAYDALSSGASVTQAAGYAPWNNTPYDSGLQPGYAAQTYTLLNWNNTGTGGGAGTTWNASTNNWGGGGTAPVAYADGDNVLFADNNNGHYNITLNSTVSPSSVVFGNSAGNYVISGSGGIAGTGFLTVNGTGSVTLSTANSYSGGTNVNSGTLIIAAPGSLPNLGNVSIGATGELKLGTGVGGSNLNTLSITTGGILDVGNNHVYVADPGGLAHDSTYTTILGEIQNGLYNGSNGYTSAAGGAILSSAGFTSPNYGIGLVDGNDGVHNTLVSANEIEVAYTLEGDANLDGKVDASDFSIFAPNFGLNTTLGWEAGDFNYDGKVDASDFSAFAPNFGLQDNGVALGLPAADYAALDAFAAANGLTITSVPEPATLGLLTIGAVGILSRRRRANH
jgi:autotransporter-associated beta strand protein